MYVIWRNIVVNRMCLTSDTIPIINQFTFNPSVDVSITQHFKYWAVNKFKFVIFFAFDFRVLCRNLLIYFPQIEMYVRKRINKASSIPEIWWEMGSSHMAQGIRKKISFGEMIGSDLSIWLKWHITINNSWLCSNERKSNIEFRIEWNYFLSSCALQENQSGSNVVNNVPDR